MIGLFSADNTRLAVTYNSLTLNSPTDAKDDTYQLDIIIPVTSVAQVVEPHPSSDGSEAFTPYKTQRIVRLLGEIRAPTLAKLFDKMKGLASACDPALIAYNNPTDSFLALDFSVPTTDTTTYATGLVPSRYYARPMRLPEPVVSSYTGLSAMFTIDFLMRDPRRYLQTAVTLAGAGTAANTAADYPSWPTITITMAGAGNAAYAIANSTTGKSLVLNLSGASNLDVYVVDMARMKITKNAVETPSIYVSGDYWNMKPGNNTVAISNTGNATTSTVWRPAFCL
jgi:hypothetical protein